MKCYNCNEKLIWGGDHDTDDQDHPIETNLSCPKCGSIVFVNWGGVDKDTRSDLLIDREVYPEESHLVGITIYVKFEDINWKGSQVYGVSDHHEIRGTQHIERGHEVELVGSYNGVEIDEFLNPELPEELLVEEFKTGEMNDV